MKASDPSPDTPAWRILKELLIRVMDISEHLGPWMWQDIPATCQLVGPVVPD